MIPKIIHIIWIGDQSKIPVRCLDSWKQKNRDYKVKVWGNNDVQNINWKNYRQLHDMLIKKDFAGAADVMRYEILYEHGGIYVDADTYCLKPLEDWLLNCQAFASWEQEIVRNNLIANTIMGSVPGAEAMKMCIEEVATKDCTEKKLAWMITGPLLVTDVFFKRQANLTVYPSHFFMSEHHSGYVSKVTGHHFASHLWGSGNGYDNIDQQLIGKSNE
jgi:inositol phosphorylceramide mannosyltransferase catalytic subunit